MHRLSIEELLKTFAITNEDIQSLEGIKEKLPILSNILIDKFYIQYLKENKEIAHYSNHADINHFLKTMKEFIVFIFTPPLDQNYLDRICKVGHVHARIKLDSSKVKYGFFGINMLLREMSVTNPLVNSNFELLSKFLAMAEHIIIDSAYYKVSTTSNNASEASLIWKLMEIYDVFLFHKENYYKVEKFMKTDEKSMSAINTIVNDPSECKCQKLLENLNKESELLKASGIDLDELKELHIKWHISISNLKSEIEEQNTKKQESHFEELTLITHKIYELIDKPLKEFSTSAFLSLNAGLKAIRAIHTIFSKHDLILKTQNDIQINVINSVKDSLQEVLAWAIEDIEISTQDLDVKKYDLTKKIKYKEFTFYFGILLKPLANKLYLKEMLILLLEALELNFSIKEREQSLREYADKAENANRAKDVFLTSMSHELRTPLTAVNGYSEVLMLRPDTPENIRGYIKKINIAGNNLLDLVNTILDFAKLEAGQMKFNPKLSSIFLILQEVEILMLPMAQKKNITLNTILDLHLYLMVDPKLFKQVMLNLMSNAIKFTPEGGEISLKLSYEEKEKEYKFSLCDNGIGISKENQEKLFQSFVQIENVYQKSEPGSGLGLMLCKKIIEELHHGRIWVESELGKGSCFNITIPTVTSTISTYSVLNAPDTAKHICIVEDSETYRRLFETYLEKKFKLTFTDTVNGAKQLLNAEKFDLILLNFYLADGIGSEVLNYMEEENLNIPVVVMSEEADLQIAHKIYKNPNIESILNKKDIEEFCKILYSKQI